MAVARGVPPVRSALPCYRLRCRLESYVQFSMHIFGTLVACLLSERECIGDRCCGVHCCSDVLALPRLCTFVSSLCCWVW